MTTRFSLFQGAAVIGLTEVRSAEQHVAATRDGDDQ